MKDEQIVELYWARNEEAIRLTERKYGAYLSKVAHNILSDLEDSRECVNDTYLRAWNSMPENRPAVLSTYLGKMTRRLAIDMFRRKNSIKRYASAYAVSLDELEDIVSGDGAPERELDAKLLNEAVNRFLRELPERERNVFIGRYYFFDPLKSIAAAFGMSEAKVKSMLYRTRQKLREHLVKEGFDV